MRALVVYCHPSPTSFTAAVRDVVVDRLETARAQITVLDLYAEGFSPVLTRPAWEGYAKPPPTSGLLARHIAALREADTLIFVYPTWWYGLPAMLKGWLDCVMLPDVAFTLPDDGPIRPGLGNIERLGVFTTCGASRGLTWLIGAPGRRTLMRGVGFLCAPRRRSVFCAQYRMDDATRGQLEAHLQRVARRVDRLVAPRARPWPQTTQQPAVYGNQSRADHRHSDHMP